MNKLVLSIDINATREAVWNAITGDESYRRWTSAFSEGSHFVGGWNTGDSIHFLGPNEDGIMAGMVSQIAESVEPELIIIRHLGMIKGDEIDMTSDLVKSWTPSLETYKLERLSDHKTRFHMDLDIPAEYYDMMEAMWIKAMAILKDVAEENPNAPRRITVATLVKAEEGKVWTYYTEPDHIKKWNAASDDWHCPAAENDLRIGGRFNYKMAAKDGSVSFDFAGKYTDLHYGHSFSYVLDDNRTVDVVFSYQAEKMCVIVNFETETENSPELQRAGWQAILDRFKEYVEGR